MLLHGEFNVLEVEFVGSFDVRGDSCTSKADAVGEKMDMYKHLSKTRPVLIVISLAGIKVCDRLGQSVLMAYPLRTVAYATCSPMTWQFAFLAQEPTAAMGQQRCHLFNASSLEQVLEINSAIQRTFGMAQDLLAMMAKSSTIEQQSRNTGPGVDAEEVSSVYTATTAWSSSTTSCSEHVKPRSTVADHVYMQRRPAVRCVSCGAVRHGSTAQGHGSPTVAAGPVRYCYNSSYNYVEAKPPTTSAYQECSALKGTSTYVDTGFRADSRRHVSRRNRRQSTTSQEVENYLCPLPCLSGGGHGSSTVSKIDLPPEQQQLCGPGRECCAVVQSQAMPLRYQNDSPFRGLQEQQDMLPLVSPQRVDSLAKTNIKSKDNSIQAVDILKQVPWFQPEMQRERVIEILSKEEIGSFIVRNSSTHPGCFALSVKVPKFDNPTGIGHYLIQRTPAGGVRIKGLDKEWSSLAALVVHHTIMPELLPCTLLMPEGASRNPCASAVNDDYDNSKAYSSTAACAAAALRTRSTPPRGFSTYGSAPRDGLFSNPTGEMKLK